MNLQTFRAPTMAEALGQVKAVMGQDAVILHTRTLPLRKWLGLRKKEIVEITAGRARGKVRPPSSPQFAEVPGQGRPMNNTAIVKGPMMNNAQRLLETSSASNGAIAGLSADVATLTAIVKDLSKQIHGQQLPDIPREMIDLYQQLLKSQVHPELATELLRNLHRHLRPEHLTQESFVKEKLAEHLEKLLPTSGPIVRTKAIGPHVVALIGPTGVGKTTTIAKLAADLKLRQKHHVGLITIDTYRIAAVDQLKRYADIIGSPLRVVSNDEEMREAVRSMHHCEFVLIDTAGRSPNDSLKLGELKTFLAAAEPEEVHLVLSTAANEECMEMAIEKFGDVRIDKIIFTKLDEAANVGTVLNILTKVKKQLSYVTNGQDVPDDIEVARGGRIARLILGINA